MNKTLNSPAGPAPGNDAAIIKSFERPDWYLKGFACNIHIRSKTILAFLGQSHCGRVLDIGCGDGSLSLPLLSRADHITFLDRSTAMLEHVKSQVTGSSAGKVACLNSDFLRADFIRGEFDLILGVGVLAYVPDVGEFLARVHYALRPGGMAIVECTDARHFVSRFNNGYRALTGLVKPRPFDTLPHSRREVLAAAEAQGFELVRQFRYTYSIWPFSRLVPGTAVPGLVRTVFGDAHKNRLRALGNQCLFGFRSLPR